MALPTKLHSEMTLADAHILPRWSVASTAARLALSVVAADVGKCALQTAPAGLWLLTNHSPMTWFPLVSRGWVGSRVITGADTIVLEDAGGKIYSNVASGHAVTIPLNATVTYTGLDVITWIQQGAGSFTVTPVSGSVTLIPPSGKTLVSKGVGAIVQATPRTGALDTWNVYGDLA